MIGECNVNFPDGSPKQRTVAATRREENLSKPFTLLFGFFFFTPKTNQEGDSKNRGNSQKCGADVVHIQIERGTSGADRNDTDKCKEG